MSTPEILGSYAEDRTLVLILKKPYTFSQAIKIMDQYITEPCTTTWNENLVGMSMLKVKFDDEAYERSQGWIAAIADVLSHGGNLEDLLAPTVAQAALEWGDNGADVVVEGEVPGSEVLRALYNEPPPSTAQNNVPDAAVPAPNTATGTQGATPKTQKEPTGTEGRRDEHVICIRVPYGANYRDFVLQFSNFGPVDYAQFIQYDKAPVTQAQRWLGYVRYINAADAARAIEGSPEWRPRTAPLTRHVGPTTECPVCHLHIMVRHERSHRKYCDELRSIQIEKKAADEQPQHLPQSRPQEIKKTKEPEVPQEAQNLRRPASQTAATEPPLATTQEPKKTGAKEAYIRPPSMGYGPLVGRKTAPGYLEVFTHRFELITIRDDEQELVNPKYSDLKKQLRQVYGTTTQDFK